MSVAIKVLQPGDETVLMNIASDVFDNPINMELTKEFLADPRHHIAVAIDDGLVVGFASGVHYIHPDKLPVLWINEVGLAPTHRRRGLGGTEGADDSGPANAMVGYSFTLTEANE